MTWAGRMRCRASRTATRRLSCTDQRISGRAVLASPDFLGAARWPDGGSPSAWRRPASPARCAGASHARSGSRCGRARVRSWPKASAMAQRRPSTATRVAIGVPAGHHVVQEARSPSLRLRRISRPRVHSLSSRAGSTAPAGRVVADGRIELFAAPCHLGAEMLLELVNLHRQCGLGDRASGRGAAEMTVLRECRDRSAHHRNQAIRLDMIARGGHGMWQWPGGALPSAPREAPAPRLSSPLQSRSTLWRMSCQHKTIADRSAPLDCYDEVNKRVIGFALEAETNLPQSTAEHR
ncbi:hypothetical protein Mnod_8180 (plasmid) [Methylobacterium nodulans ORS 2060]|uniref:Uncharacterized protein n=1 Tax=Methylobacterium nodulans (strain LMG 21967 / CNCM I-2342 / ORS 2060) TaxID=460265 RepID=B8IXB5_METNO|nr:hypothetical protein Mnod_8180 [Methylobacterium nodulans ORS 2060]